MPRGYGRQRESGYIKYKGGGGCGGGGGGGGGG